MVYGVEHLEQAVSSLTISHQHMGNGRPDRGVRILTAILAHARQVALYVTGVLRCLIEGGGEK